MTVWRNAAIKMAKRAFDSRWNSKARPVFRVLSALLAAGVLPMGLMALAAAFSHHGAAFNSRIKVGSAAIIAGVIFLTVAIRGRLIK